MACRADHGAVPRPAREGDRAPVRRRPLGRASRRHVPVRRVRHGALPVRDEVRIGDRLAELLPPDRRRRGRDRDRSVVVHASDGGAVRRLWRPSRARVRGRATADRAALLHQLGGADPRPRRWDDGGRLTPPAGAVAPSPASIPATMAGTRYDCIIVGGGSAGSALANRPSGAPGARVLVLEAGRSDWRIDPFIHMPAALTFPIGSRFYDWRYRSEPEPFMNGRRIYHARGKVLGGSSSINGQIFQRGNPLDYERWASDAGMGDWDYAHCLPYFKKMEKCMAARDEPTGPDSHTATFRGTKGPLVLERGAADTSLFDAFFAAV